MKHLYRPVLWALVLMGVAATRSYGQQYSVKGKISASGVPIRYAIVTFIDNSNSSLKYTAVTDSAGAFDIGTITGVKPSTQLPASFQLEQNYPNPFSSKTAISYNLDKKSDVKVTIYDVLGRVVRNFSIGYQAAGVHGIIWDGRDMLGKRVATGVYFYRLQARGRSEVRKMLFGIGAPNASVSLSGLLPSGASRSGLEREVASQSEPFTVMIANTDSTYPLIVPTQLSLIRIGSDTSLTFSALQKLNPAIVYPDSTAQLIEGFGAANVLILGRPDMTASQIQTAFGTGSNDLGFSIMRVSIPADSTQFASDVPSIKLAEALGVKVIASPWTPPAWMKTNHSPNGGSLDTNDYGAYAAHLKAFADTLAEYGDSVYAISVQNEPDFSGSYQSCVWTPAQLLRFMKYYAPQIGTRVFMPESESFNHAMSDPTLEDSTAAAHTAFIGGHLYGTTPRPYPLAVSKGKQIWMTEHLTSSDVASQTWAESIPVAKEINDCMDAGMSAYVWWYLVRYYGPLGDGTSGSVLGQITKRGYAMSQYSRFVRPGYHRVFATENPQPDLYLTAYKGSGKTVIVIVNMNSNSTLQPITINNSNVTSFTPHVSSSTKNCVQESTVTVSNGKFTAILDPSSVTTFVSN